MVVAVECEIPEILTKYSYNQLYKFKKYKLKDNSEIILAVTQPGKENAIATTEDLLKNFDVDYVINLGFSGGAYENAQVGDIIVAENIRYYNKTIELDKKLLKKAISAISSRNLQYKVGNIQVSDNFVLSTNNVHSDILAIDMESFHIAKTSLKYNTKTLIVRILSDVLSKRDPKYFTKLHIKFKLKKGVRKAGEQLNKFFKAFFEL